MMKVLITLPVTKTVDTETRWVAQDRSGMWFAYSTRPRPDKKAGQWYQRSGTCNEIVKGEPNPDWEFTLINIKKYKAVTE